MNETIVNSILSQELEKGRTVVAKIQKECDDTEGYGGYQVNINLCYHMAGSYDDMKLDVLNYFNKLKLDTSKLMIDSAGNPVTIDSRFGEEPVKIVDVPAEQEIGTKPKKRGWPKGKKKPAELYPQVHKGRPKGKPRKPKVETTTEDLLTAANHKKSKLDKYSFFNDLPEDNVFSQAGRS